MAAAAAERLFSLELLVDWVRLEPGLPPRAAGPAVAFSLLDFPPLLVLPPAAPVPASQHGAVGFGRGKACLLRLRPAVLRRSRLRAALLLLQPAGPAPAPAPAPLLLGSCDLPLAAAAGGGRRGTFSLSGPAGEHVGDLALFYRLIDLGRSPSGASELQIALSPTGPVKSVGPQAGEPRPRSAPEPRPQDAFLLGPKGTSKPPQKGGSKRRGKNAAQPRPKDANGPAGDSHPSSEPKRREEAGFCSLAGSRDSGTVENGRAHPDGPPSPPHSGDNARPLSPELAEPELETNIICPPPLYYTHVMQEKKTPARVEITIEPQRNGPEELDGVFPETKLVNPPPHLSPLKHTSSSAQERPPALDAQRARDIGAVNPATLHPPVEQSTVDTIRQLPLLNALLIELSLLYNQPVASPSQVHPHLAWLYKTEHQGSEPSARSAPQSESKKTKLSVGEHEKAMGFHCHKNGDENLEKSKGFSGKVGSPPQRVRKGRLLYGLTNTLRLRLKQTNPGLLVIHEKREEYRRLQIQAVGAKSRRPACRGPVFSVPELRQAQLPRENDGALDESVAGNSGTSRQVSGVFDESLPLEGSCAPEKETNEPGVDRISQSSLEAAPSPADSFASAFWHTDVLRGKGKVRSPGVSRQDGAIVQSVDEVDDGQVSATGKKVMAAIREDRLGKSSSCESVSEPKYSDDFTSPCYSEDFSTEVSSRSLLAPSSVETDGGKLGSRASKLSQTRPEHGSGQSPVLSPPFSAGSPVCSQRGSRILKPRDTGLEDTSSMSTSDCSLSHWTSGKESQRSPHTPEPARNGQDLSRNLNTGTGCKSSEKSQSPHTSQISSYLPSNFSELELKALDSDSFEEDDDDDLGSLTVSKQCKDICELVINKLPGYTV